jgi:hypothetical protein
VLLWSQAAGGLSRGLHAFWNASQCPIGLRLTQRSRPRGLQSGFGAADVAALAGAVAPAEQAELFSVGAAKIFGCGRIIEHVSCGGQQLFVGCEQQLLLDR